MMIHTYGKSNLAMTLILLRSFCKQNWICIKYGGKYILHILGIIGEFDFTK